MAAFIFDASAIVKRYVQEVGTGWVQALSAPAAGHELFLSRVTRVEVTATITRRGRGGLPGGVSFTTLLSQFRYNAIHQYNILEIIPAFLIEAERLAEVHGLRGYDAVQLAVAMSLHQDRLAAGMSGITLISADGELNTAAQAEGLAVDDPNLHP
jgi:predicted nucleic acid-binding protein